MWENGPLETGNKGRRELKESKMLEFVNWMWKEINIYLFFEVLHSVLVFCPCFVMLFLFLWAGV